jgi:hypothetical protein
MLLEQFIKAVSAFRNRPAMLRQALRDAEIYYRSGDISLAELNMLKKLAMDKIYG